MICGWLNPRVWNRGKGGLTKVISEFSPVWWVCAPSPCIVQLYIVKIVFIITILNCV